MQGHSTGVLGRSGSRCKWNPKLIKFFALLCSAGFACVTGLPVSAQTSSSTAAPVTQSEAPEEVRFEISQFEILGPALVPRARLQEVLQPFLNAPLTFSRLRSATLGLERVHALAGYEMVRVIIPEQRLASGGPLKLQIVDLRLAEVLVDGAKHFSSEWVRDQLPSLVKDEVVNTRQMDREIRLMNSNPSINTGVSLEPGFEPRKVDALVRFSDQPTRSMFLTLDNTGAEATGEFRSGLVFQENNVAGKGHQFTGQVVTSPGHWSDVKVFSLSYKWPVATWRTLFELAYIDSSVNAGTLDAGGGGILSIQGSGQQLALRGSYMLERLQGFESELVVSYQLKRFDSDVRLNSGNSSIVPDTASRPLGLGLKMTRSDDDYSTDLSITYFTNFESGSNNSQEAYDAASNRTSATGSFSRVNFDLVKGNLTHSGPFYQDWRYSASVDFQFTKDSLISGEQFGAGGMNSVRGFDERAISADGGYDFSFEVQSGNWLKESRGMLQAFSGVAFFDAAALRATRAGSGAATEPFICSMGLGLRLTLAPAQLIRIDLARVVSGVETQPHGDVMVHFSYAAVL